MCVEVIVCYIIVVFFWDTVYIRQESYAVGRWLSNDAEEPKQIEQQCLR